MKLPLEQWAFNRVAAKRNDCICEIGNTRDMHRVLRVARFPVPPNIHFAEQ